MADAPRLLEADEVLKRASVETLQALTAIAKDDKVFEALLEFFKGEENRYADRIIRSAGAQSSLDALINVSADQNFYRGKISTFVLLGHVIKNAPLELEKRAEGAKGK